jgi:hypothetical protein
MMADFQYAREFHTEEKDLYLARCQQYLKATGFAAMLLSKNKFASALPLEASNMLAIGLEHCYDGESDEAALVGRDEWQILVPVATTWLSVAGKTIYEHCQDEDLYDGWERGTWNLKPWDLWKEQLGELAKREDFNKHCRELATQTVRKMAEIEAAPPEPPLAW